MLVVRSPEANAVDSTAPSTCSGPTGDRCSPRSRETDNCRKLLTRYSLLLQPSATLRFITIILAAVASRPPARGAVPAGDRPADSVLCCDAAIGIETQLLPRTFMPMRPFASQSLLISVRTGSLQCSSKLQIRNRPRFLALPSRLSA